MTSFYDMQVMILISGCLMGAFISFTLTVLRSKNKRLRGNSYAQQLPAPYKAKIMLYFTDSKQKNKTFKILLKEDMTIGRNGDNELTLAYDNTVSAHHCRIFKRDNQYILTDLSSSNGTFLNGVRVLSESILLSGDTITIGQAELTFKAEVIN